MKQTDTDYLTMVSVTDKMLANNEVAWKASPPAVRQVTAIRALDADLKVAQQGTTTETTGITEDTETAVQQAIDEAITLSKAVRSYAQEQKNSTLNNQFKISERFLNRFSNGELVEYLRDMLQRMQDMGAPLAEFEVTPAKLTAFEALIDEADKRKSDTRLAITGRKGQNKIIPQKMTELRHTFSILDNLVSSWKKDKPDFVRDYFNARQVIDTGGRGGRKDKLDGDKPKA